MNHLTLETNDGIALLTIDRQKALNALNSEVLSELGDALLGLELDAEIKVVILTGAGEKAFVAGADIAEMAQIDPPDACEFSRKGQQTILFIEKMKKPVIAAVNGFALGGGLELAMACDFIYASERAKLGLPEVTLGIMPGFGGTQNLSRAIGPKRASEMVFSGKMYTAQKLMDWGLINEVVPAEELLPKVKEVAALIANVGLLGVAAAKDALVNGLNMSKADGFKYESVLFGNLFATQDQREGMNAFLEKRKPTFSNR